MCSPFYSLAESISPASQRPLNTHFFLLVYLFFKVDKSYPTPYHANAYKPGEEENSRKESHVYRAKGFPKTTIVKPLRGFTYNPRPNKEDLI
jgi:hypothetical protein